MSAPISIDSGVLTLSTMEKDLNELEDHIKSTKEAQSALNKNAAFFAQFLHDFNESEALYDLQPYTAKLHDVHRRLTTVDSTMTSVHDRLSALQRQIAREIFKHKKTLGSSGGDVVVPEAPAH